MLNVTYIQHSCFLVELDHTLLLFDYFDSSAVEQIRYEGKLPELPKEKKLYVFASHSHKDHFSLEVLRWAADRSDICYILSKDIRLGKNHLERNGIDPGIREKIRFVTPVSRYEIDDLVIQTLRSTDAGVAFVVEAEGKTIYHAGDLHWWNGGPSGELYSEIYGNSYKREIHRIANRHIDVAFVVLDGRMGNSYHLGMEFFLQNIDADLVFPMHLWKEYDLIEKFKRRPQLGRLAEKVVDIDRENIVFEIEE